MENIWNESNLQQPPLITVPVRNSKLNLTNLRKILDDAIIFYENQKDFDEAAALCSRLIARRKNSFRRMLGFKNMCKLNSALCRLLRIDIKTILHNFIGILPDYISSVSDTYLPSISCLEYVLIRLISLHKLMQRIIDCSEMASTYFIQLLNFSHFQDTLILFLSVLSQIWNISHKIAIRTGNYYEKLLNYRFDFPKNKKPWLSDNIEFPEKLEFPQLQNIKKEEGHISKTKINFVNELSSTTTPQVSDKSSKEFKKLHENIDLGTIINRNSFSNPTQKSENYQVIQSINNVNEIRKFFVVEEKRRRQSLKQAITKNITHGEWITFKKSVINRITANDDKKAIKIFKSFVKNKLS